MGREKQEIRALAEAARRAGDQTGWFEQVYRDADGDRGKVVWADLVPNPCLVDWLKGQRPAGERAIVIGCGLGDDVAFLAAQGLAVVGFDIAATAIAMCKERFPAIGERFVVADLFASPPEWSGGFDLVFECNTIQALSGEHRLAALNAIAALVAPGGELLVSCRSRNPGELEDAFPLPLDRHEIAGFERAGLTRTLFRTYDDDQSPPVAHFFACYRRPAA